MSGRVPGADPPPGPGHRAPTAMSGRVPGADLSLSPGDTRQPTSGGGGPASPLVPGEVVVGEEPVTLFAGRPVLQLVVRNTGDRAVQVGSHFHFAQANPALLFDRAAAGGHRLAVPAGTSVRFEPGIAREVSLVPLGGRRVVPGLRRGLPRAPTPDLPDPGAPTDHG